MLMLSMGQGEFEYQEHTTVKYIDLLTRFLVLTDIRTT